MTIFLETEMDVSDVIGELSLLPWDQKVKSFKIELEEEKDGYDTPSMRLPQGILQSNDPEIHAEVRLD